MKEILDNWNHFLAEQRQSRKWGNEETINLPGIGSIPTKIYDHYENQGFIDPLEWQLRSEQVQAIGNEVKAEFFKDFASKRAIKSFIAHSRKKKDGTILDFLTPEKEMIRFYKEVLLPEIKKIINNVPIYAFYHPNVPEYAVWGVFEHGDLGSYLWDEQIIVINPFAKEVQDGAWKVDLVFYEELAHAVDLQLDFRTAGDMFYGKPRKLSDVFGAELQKLLTPDADLKKLGYDRPEDPEWVKYMRNPIELYAKLRAIKAYYGKEYGEKAFNPDGTIKKDFLEKGFNDENEADFLFDFFDIDKVDDLKKVIDQLVKVDKKMSKGSKMA